MGSRAGGLSQPPPLCCFLGPFFPSTLAPFAFGVRGLPTCQLRCSVLCGPPWTPPLNSLHVLLDIPTNFPASPSAPFSEGDLWIFCLVSWSPGAAVWEQGGGLPRAPFWIPLASRPTLKGNCRIRGIEEESAFHCFGAVFLLFRAPGQRGRNKEPLSYPQSGRTQSHRTAVNSPELIFALFSFIHPPSGGANCDTVLLSSWGPMHSDWVCVCANPSSRKLGRPQSQVFPPIPPTI